MKKPCKLNKSKYAGLVRDLNSRTAHMPPLFDENQQLDESELVDYLAKKAPRNHKAMLISEGFSPKQDIMWPSWNTSNRQRPRTTSLWIGFLPQTRTATEKKIKNVPSSRNVRKTVRNIIRKTPHFIALSMVKIKVTPLGSAKYSRQGLNIKTILSIKEGITRRNSKKWTYWRENLLTKEPSI